MNGEFKTDPQGSVQWLTKGQRVSGSVQSYSTSGGDARLGKGNVRRKASPAERKAIQERQPYRVMVMDAMTGARRMVTLPKET